MQSNNESTHDKNISSCLTKTLLDLNKERKKTLLFEVSMFILVGVVILFSAILFKSFFGESVLAKVNNAAQAITNDSFLSINRELTYSKNMSIIRDSISGLISVINSENNHSQPIVNYGYELREIISLLGRIPGVGPDENVIYLREKAEKLLDAAYNVDNSGPMDYNNEIYDAISATQNEIESLEKDKKLGELAKLLVTMSELLNNMTENDNNKDKLESILKDLITVNNLLYRQRHKLSYLREVKKKWESLLQSPNWEAARLKNAQQLIENIVRYSGKINNTWEDNVVGDYNENLLRVEKLEKNLETEIKNIPTVDWERILIRVAILTIALFLIQILFSAYKYARKERSRIQDQITALHILIDAESKEQVLTFNSLIECLSKTNANFDNIPKTLIEVVADAVSTGIQKAQNKSSRGEG